MRPSSARSSKNSSSGSASNAAGPDQKIRELSGGNQQKVLLARWLAMNPKLLILDEPTRGIDVGAKAEIQSLIKELADQGLGVLMISSELEEVHRRLRSRLRAARGTQRRRILACRGERGRRDERRWRMATANSSPNGATRMSQATTEAERRPPRRD